MVMNHTLVSTAGGAYSSTELSGKTHVGALAQVISSRIQAIVNKTEDTTLAWSSKGRIEPKLEYLS